MFGIPAPREFLIVIAIILVLYFTGMWPSVMRALRELRGEKIEDEPRQAQRVPQQQVEFYYRLLGLSPTAPWEDVEKAYRQKAKIHHPDRGGDADAMRSLNEAYQFLKKQRRTQA